VTSRHRGRTRPCGWWTLSAPPDRAAPAAAPARDAVQCTRTRVTPTRRLAHHLRARHDADCLARGLEVWDTPDIVTWDELIERMFALDRQAGRLAGRWLPASASQLLWARIVRDDPERSPLVSPAGVARAAFQSWRNLHDYGLPIEVLDEGDSQEAAAFARWSRQYRQALTERGWVDGPQAQSQVHAVAAAPGLEFVGFDRLTPLQELLLARWERSGLEVRQLRSDALGASGDRVGRVSCVDAAAEIEAAARWAAERLDGQRDRRVAIVVPELGRRRQSVRRIIERVLAPATGLSGGPVPESQGFELAAARPLAEQPAVGAALDLLEVFIRPPDLAALSRLLRSSHLAASADEAAARSRLDARLRRFEKVGLGHPGLARLALARDCPTLALSLTSAQAVVSRWPEKEFPSNCSNYIFSLLAAMGWPGNDAGATEYQAVQRWRSLVREFGACDEFTGRVSRVEAVGLLREMAGRVLFEPQELRAPLLVIDPETSAGMTFDAIWVCGLESGAWPPPAAPDPFLPRHAQVRYGLPRATAALAAERSRLVFERLLASAPEVILSVAEVERDAPLLPSPLLAGIAAVEAPAGWREPRVASDQYSRRPALESFIDVTMPKVRAGEGARGGARLLELQAACPFRAQAELRLGARALDEPEAGVDAAERGELVHAALAHLWRELRDQATLRALDDAARRSAVQRAVAAALVKALDCADGLLRHLLVLEADWLEARVLEMTEIDLGRPPFVVAALEEACTARIGELSLELRPDRVDRLEDDSLVVIDYKTGANAAVKSWLGERPRLPQLPAYVQALGPERVSAVAFARVRSGDTGYAGLARAADRIPGLKVPGMRGELRAYDSWEMLLAEWERRLEALAAEYVAGDVQLAPDPREACKYCHLGALCRIAETRAAVQGEEWIDE
jgi:ATP-dependent helicase/nuclease subunit B